MMMSTVYPLDEIRSRLKPVFDAAPVYRAVLFGSYAKGKATESSDIDIVIDSCGELLNIDFYSVLEDITETLGKKIDLFEITEIKQHSPLYSEIQNEGVLLYDRQG